MSKPKDTDLEGNYDGDQRRKPFDPEEWRLKNSTPAQRRKIQFNKVNRSGKGDKQPVGLAPFKDRKGGQPVEKD